ncbi:hypothetical protein ONS96_008668 [Cadophora gregata f. sp. sojae]|nr:hypothetical protein ONS96_008668 [Cadophora gregata f. sp. sojae]
MVSARWLAIFDRAIRKPRPITNRQILQSWVNIYTNQLRVRPRDTHEQCQAAAEVRWWNFLSEIYMLEVANEFYFDNLPGDARQWRNIVRKAVQSGHKIASLCQSWIDVRVELAANHYLVHRQQTDMFAYAAEVKWFKRLFPNEAFMGRPPQEWLEYEFARESADHKHRYEEQKILGARHVRLWLGILPVGASLTVNPSPNVGPQRDMSRLQADASSSIKSSVTMQAEPQRRGVQTKPNRKSTKSTPAPPPRTESRKGKPNGPIQSTKEPRKPSQHPGRETKRRPTAPWEEQGISADEWSTSFLDSIVSQYQNSANEQVRQTPACKRSASRFTEMPAENSAEGDSRKRVRVE